jgi:hypothetical protein
LPHDPRDVSAAIIRGNLDQARLELSQLTIVDRRIRGLTPASNIEQIYLSGQAARHGDALGIPTEIGEDSARIHEPASSANDLLGNGFVLSKRPRWIDYILEILDQERSTGNQLTHPSASNRQRIRDVGKQKP